MTIKLHEAMLMKNNIFHITRLLARLGKLDKALPNKQKMLSSLTFTDYQNFKIF